MRMIHFKKVARNLFLTAILLGTAGLQFIFAEMNPPSETELLERQTAIEKDLEHRVQNILDKVLGPNQSEVKATVNLSILKQVEKRTGAGQQTRKKPISDDETKFVLPGVPRQQNVNKEEQDNIEKQRAEQEKAQTQVSFKVNITNRQVVAFYNERLKPKEAEARKAVMAMTDLMDNELKFIPGKFFDWWTTFWVDFIRDPKNLIYTVLLFLFLMLLVWLFIPLTAFFKNYIRAMKEKGGIEVKMENQDQEMEEKEKTPEELAAEGLEGEGGDGEVKKYLPFEYINEENLKRLLGVFRKEPPQVIALILSYLKPEIVKKIYAELPVELQTRVAAESAAVRQTSEEQVRMIDADIKAKIDFLVGGVDNLISILEEVDYRIRDNILEYLKDHKPQLYQKVRDALLLFEDLPNVPDLSMQTIIRELKTDQLARALKNSNPEIMNKFLSNMSQGGAALLKEEMEFGRPVTDEQIELERQSIMEKIKEMEAQSKIQVREKKKISIFESEDATSPLSPRLPEEGGMMRPSPAAQPAVPAQAGVASGSSEETQSYLAYGQQLYSEQKYDEAISYLQYATETDPSNADAYQILGHAYYALGLMAEALQSYENFLALRPSDTDFRQWVDELKQSAGV